MTIPAHEQLRQLMQIIPRLADDREHNIREVASTLELRVEDVLSALGSIGERYDVPAGFVERFGIFIENDSVSVITDHLRRPMRLTMAELCALELGLNMLRPERVVGDQAPVDRALERLRAAISQLPANDQQEGIQYAELARGAPSNISPLFAQRIVSTGKFISFTAAVAQRLHRNGSSVHMQ